MNKENEGHKIVRSFKHKKYTVEAFNFLIINVEKYELDDSKSLSDDCFMVQEMLAGTSTDTIDSL